MRKIGFVGLGKLGFPCATAIAQKGHTVNCYDINQNLVNDYKNNRINLHEPHMKARFMEVKEKIVFKESIEQVVENSEIIFLAIETPHPPELDGSIRHNHVRMDFDYRSLLSGAREIAQALNKIPENQFKVISIISTVLPGTMREQAYPVMKAIVNRPIGKGWGLCYNPFFIAMGTTIHDFTNPEFTLIGQNLDTGDNEEAGKALADFYDTIQSSPKLRMTWDSAEGVKMFYNTFIGMKVIFANTIMQICHKTPGADVDVICKTLQKGHDRLISPRYLDAGMGDGGGCHPRDNLALSYLSDKLGLSYNLFDFVMTVREQQTEWLADLMLQHEGPKVIMGKTYKPHTNLIYGSPSVLLANILKERGHEPIIHDPVIAADVELPQQPAVYLIGTNWPVYKEWKFKKGDVVIDPWGMIENQEGVHVVRVGRK